MTPSRSDLPAGRSWPLRKSEVESALAEAGLPEVSDVRQYVPFEPRSGPHRTPELVDRLPDGYVIHVDWEPTAGRGIAAWSDGPEVVTVWMRDVPSAQKPAITQSLKEQVLPELVTWLRAAQAAPEGWKILRHRHAWGWVDGTIHSREIESAGFGRLR